MSRSVKQARGNAGSQAPTNGSANQWPDVTTKDGSANVAGDVTKFNTDNYQPAPFATDND